jgi:hypothetical protein
MFWDSDPDVSWHPVFDSNLLLTFFASDDIHSVSSVFQRPFFYLILSQISTVESAVFPDLH